MSANSALVVWSAALAISALVVSVWSGQVRRRRRLGRGRTSDAVFWSALAPVWFVVALVVSVVVWQLMYFWLGIPAAILCIYAARWNGATVDVIQPSALADEPLAQRPGRARPWLHACALDPECTHPEHRERLYIHPLRLILDFGPRADVHGWKDLAS